MRKQVLWKDFQKEVKSSKIRIFLWYVNNHRKCQKQKRIFSLSQALDNIHFGSYFNLEKLLVPTFSVLTNCFFPLNLSVSWKEFTRVRRNIQAQDTKTLKPCFSSLKMCTFCRTGKIFVILKLNLRKFFLLLPNIWSS